MLGVEQHFTVSRVSAQQGLPVFRGHAAGNQGDVIMSAAITHAAHDDPVSEFFHASA